eukprot:scaffold133127_cov19-Tisochrysis_lutea.AAC.1
MKICSQKYECCYSVYGGLNDNNNRMSLNAAYKQDSNKFLDVHTLVQLLGALSCQQLQLVYTLVVTNTSKSERHIQLLPHLYSSYTSGYSQRLIKHVSGLTCFPGSNAGKVIDQSFQTLACIVGRIFDCHLHVLIHSRQSHAHHLHTLISRALVSNMSEDTGDFWGR